MNNEYIILESDDSQDLSKAVNRFLQDGWVLQGNLVAAVRPESDTNNGVYLYQAMTREKTSNIEVAELKEIIEEQVKLN